MAHWSHNVIKVLESDTGNLKNLAKLGGLDWRTAYSGISLAGCDLRGQDLRGMELDGCDLGQARIDDETQIDAEFDPRVDSGSIYVKFVVSRELARLVRIYSKEANYVYVAWAYRSLIDLFCHLYRFDHVEKAVSQIKENDEFMSLVATPVEGPLHRRDVLLESWKIELLLEAEVEYPNFDIQSLALFTAILHRKNVRSKRPDSSMLSINAIWPRSA